MRSALTMIELIFVIIILGVLASVALPKLAATRDDAKIAVMAQQAEGAIAEILQRYTATGVVQKPQQMSQILQQLIHTQYAAETTDSPIAGSLGQLTLYTQDGSGSNDHTFVFDINQTTLVFRHGSPCAGIICKALHQRVSEGNYSVGTSGVIF
ncbi:MAG TPA: type II secretion system protein [Campylobacteraceae bacterium]|nr:type II secretion system protein [Campylobacteraceae bacterium]